MLKRLISIPALLAALLAAPLAAQHDQHDHTLEVSRALPEAMISGKHYRIVDPVINDFALDQFHVVSDFGDYNVYGQMDLRILLREIAAIGTLQEVTGGQVTADVAKYKAGRSIKAVGNVAAHPIQTAKGITKGLKKRFMKFTRDVEEDVQTAVSRQSTGDKAKTYAERYFKVDKAKRRWAGKLNVDPYTPNVQLQAELDRVAQMEAGAGFLIPSLPGTGLFRDAYKLVTESDPRELHEHNLKKLVSLGVDEALVRAFLDLEAFNPTMSTLMVASLAEMDTVADEIVVIDQAMTVQSRPEALFLLECVVMASWFHETREPLQRMLLTTGVPAAVTRSGKVVVFMATDFPHWTPEIAQIIRNFKLAYEGISNDRLMLLAGNASKTFKAQSDEMGWNYETHLRNAYLSKMMVALSDEELANL